MWKVGEGYIAVTREGRMTGKLMVVVIAVLVMDLGYCLRSTYFPLCRFPYYYHPFRVCPLNNGEYPEEEEPTRVARKVVKDYGKSLFLSNFPRCREPE